MATDPTPTVALGNETQNQFNSRDEWSVNPQNQGGEDDTFVKWRTCVVALEYRTYKAYFEWLNGVLACLPGFETPLGLKAAAVQTPHHRATDDDGTTLTNAKIIANGTIPTPNMLFTCNGTGVDDTDGAQFLTDGNGETDLTNVYSVVNSPGRDGTSGALILGLRPSQNKWYPTLVHDATVTTSGAEVMYSANYVVEWPQANTGVILAKITNQTTLDEGAGRMLWEFGLGQGRLSDTNADPQNWVLYVRYKDADFNDVWFQCLDSAGHALGVSSGREFTLAFAMYQIAGDEFEAKFFVNGVKLGATSIKDPFSNGSPTVGGSVQVMLHVGSGALGEKYCGGPANNVYISTDIDQNSDHDGIANALYQIGAGYS